MLNTNEKRLLAKYLANNAKNWKQNKNGDVVLDIDDLLELNRFKRFLGVIARNPLNKNQNVKIKKIDANSIKEALLYVLNLINFTNKLIEHQSKQQKDFERITAFLNNLEH